MTEYSTEITGFEPHYHERGDMDQCARLSLSWIEVSVMVRKEKRNAIRMRYTLKFEVTSGGTVRLIRVGRPDREPDYAVAWQLAACLTAAEAAVADWINREDAANLALQHFAARLDLAAEDEWAPPFTTEAEAREAADE